MRRAALGAAGARCGSASSSTAARNYIDQLGNLAALIGFVAGRDGVLDAMGRVIGQNFLLGAPQRGAHGRKLRYDIDAVAVIFDHARKTAHLTFDPPQPFQH